MNIILLTEKINEICPIHGLDTNRNLSFKDEATDDLISQYDIPIVL